MQTKREVAPLWRSRSCERTQQNISWHSKSNGRTMGVNRLDDLISRQAAIDAVNIKIKKWNAVDGEGYHVGLGVRYTDVIDTLAELPAVQPLVIHCTDCEDWLERQSILGVTISELPSAQPEQRYTEEELRVFQHGISLSLLSKRSAQHWHYDEDTATEIKFLERLYEKVGADIRGERDEE